MHFKCIEFLTVDLLCILWMWIWYKKKHTLTKNAHSLSEWKFVVNQKKQSSFKFHWSLERVFSFGVVVISINKHKWWVIYFHKQILNIHLHSLHSVAAGCACESVCLSHFALSISIPAWICPTIIFLSLKCIMF